MTRLELKAKIHKALNAAMAYGLTLDRKEMELATGLQVEIDRQIDVMYQGADDDEDFEDDEWYEDSRQRAIEDKMDEIAARYDD